MLPMLLLLSLVSLLSLVVAEDFRYAIGSHDICYPTTQLGNKFVGPSPDPIKEAEQGLTVALSGNGQIFLLSGRSDNSSFGGFWVYARNPTTGLFEPDGNGASKLYSTDASSNGNQGLSMAISFTGTTAAIGGASDGPNLSQIGAVWIWIRDTTTNPGVVTWVLQGPKLVGPVTGNSSIQGVSLAMSGSGDLFAAGGFGDTVNGNQLAGSVWIWKRNTVTKTWSFQKKLSGTVAQNYFGYGVDLSLDGTILAVGEPGYNNQQGRVSIFISDPNDSTIWTLSLPQLVSTPIDTPLSIQGVSVDLSDDGSLLLVRGANDANSGGIHYIWARNGNTWTQKQSIIDGNIGFLSRRSSLSGDGSILVIGGDPVNEDIGGVSVYVRNLQTNKFNLITPNKLIGTGALNSTYYRGASQGGGTAVSQDGTVVAWGGSTDDSTKGAAWIFASAGVSTVQYASHNDCLIDDGTLETPTYFKVECALDQYWVSSSKDCATNLQGPFPLLRDTCFQAQLTPTFKSQDFLHVHCTCPKGKYENAALQCADQTVTAVTLLGRSGSGGKYYLDTNQNLVAQVTNSPQGGAVATGVVNFKKKNGANFVNIGSATLVNGKATFQISDKFNAYQGPLTIQVNYGGDHTHAPVSQLFDVTFYSFPTTGTYLLGSIPTQPANINKTVFFYTPDWPTKNSFSETFNGWIPTPTATPFAGKCNTAVTLVNSPNKKVTRKFLGVGVVSAINSGKATFSKIAVVDTTGAVAGQGKLVAVFCPP